MQIVMHGMTITYEEFGSGPAVLFVGGRSDDSDGWQRHIQTLVVAGYRVIVHDFCIAEAASTMAEQCRTEVQSDAVVGLLNYLGIGRAALIGRPAGEQVLHALLQRHPQRVAAVVIAEKFERAGSGGKVKELKKLMRKQSKGRVEPADCGTEVVGNLLVFLNKLKQFRPRYPLVLQMA